MLSIDQYGSLDSKNWISIQAAYENFFKFAKFTCYNVKGMIPDQAKTNVTNFLQKKPFLSAETNEAYVRRIEIDNNGITTHIPSNNINILCKKRKRDFETVLTESKKLKTVASETTLNGTQTCQGDLISYLRKNVSKAKKSFSEMLDSLSLLNEKKTLEVVLKDNQTEIDFLIKELETIGKMKDKTLELLDKNKGAK